MKIEQNIWLESVGWEKPPEPGFGEKAQLVLLFGSRALLNQKTHLNEIKARYPQAHLLGCSTAGEIYGTQVTDDSLVTTGITFEHSTIKCTQLQINPDRTSLQVGETLAKSLPHDGLVHVFVLSDGLEINGSELVEGLTSHLPSDVTLTGGLSGDGDRFQETLVLLDGPPVRGTVAVLGLYGKRLKIGFGSLGGWDSFGPERLITRSKGNILYEMDHKSALELYKTYLGAHAKKLPSSGLLFPLSLRTEGEEGVVRTILSVNEADQSMTFAGDMPQGAYARLMKANFDRLIDGSISAATTCHHTIGTTPPDLAILISCVGRKLLLKQRVEEEVEGVQDVFGKETVLTGFYSYGEISPFTLNGKCELHNQTMTITTLSET